MSEEEADDVQEQTDDTNGSEALTKKKAGSEDGTSKDAAKGGMTEPEQARLDAVKPSPATVASPVASAESKEKSISSNPCWKFSSTEEGKHVTFRSTPCFGGEGGTPFDDDCLNEGIAGIAIRAGAVVDGVTMFYRGGKITSYGGKGGNEESIFLCQDEYVTEIDVRFGRFVQCLTLKTNKGRPLGPCGGKGGLLDGTSCNNVTIKAPQGHVLVGIKGREGRYLDSIGFHFRLVEHSLLCPEDETSPDATDASHTLYSTNAETIRKLTSSPCFGGNGGTPFDDGYYNIRITRIAIRAGDVVDRISITYYNGKVTSYGGNGGQEGSITLEHGEYVTEIRVRARKVVQCLTFVTSMGRQLGPCGGKGILFWDSCGAEMVVKAPKGSMLIGITGRGGKFLDSIGFHWSPIPS